MKKKQAKDVEELKKMDAFILEEVERVHEIMERNMNLCRIK